MKFLTIFRTLVLVGVLTGISLGQAAVTQDPSKETPAAAPTPGNAAAGTPAASTTPPPLRERTLFHS